MITDSSRKRSSRRNKPIPTIDMPSNRNMAPSNRRTGGRSGARKRAPNSGASTQIRPKQTTPMAIPAVEAARMSSLDSTGFCTSAEASPIRTKNRAKSTTSWASAISPKATGSTSREIVMV